MFPRVRLEREKDGHRAENLCIAPQIGGGSRGERIPWPGKLNYAGGTVSPLTSAECLAIAERKIVEAMSDRRHGKELKLTAQAWMVLAEQVKQADALKKQAEAREVAEVAPDIASTAASSDCGSLKQIADDIRTFHLCHPASYA
jgi:hypothetical protein